MEQPVYDIVLSAINNGLIGLNKGIPSQNSFINKCLCGINRGTYYLLGAELGTGKTAFVDEAFVISAYEYMRNIKMLNKLKIIYFSFEIKYSKKLVKWICRKMYMDNCLQLDINTILSRGDKCPPDNILEITNMYKDYFNDMKDVITPIEYSMSGSELIKKLYEISLEHGKWDENNINGNYFPDDPERRILIIIDHIGLIKKNKYNDKKNTLDDMSEYIVRLRNKCNFSFVLTSQLNRDQSKRERPLKDKFGPQLSDFKDTGNTQEDADVILGIYNPFKNKAKEFIGLDITSLGKDTRTLHILKNRDGHDDVATGYMLNGAIGHFKEINY